eukprot:jgi/Chlat1/839/Chrsp104S01183
MHMGLQALAGFQPAVTVPFAAAGVSVAALAAASSSGTGRHNGAAALRSRPARPHRAFSRKRVGGVQCAVRTAAEQDYIKAGGADIGLVQRQAQKQLDQTPIAEQLESYRPDEHGQVDLAVVGCGPAGLALAAEAAGRGLTVTLIGPDMPFVNNYGVWHDEFQALGLEHTVDQVWQQTECYFNSDQPVRVDRAYARVSRERLRQELLRRCQATGVLYLNSAVDDAVIDGANGSILICDNGSRITARLVTVCAGAASGKFLKYEDSGLDTGVQTAYGIEAEVEDYPYDKEAMLFMDYRSPAGAHPTETSSPTFLYAMPIEGNIVFLEETCLVARPALSFDELKQRLQRRLDAMGVRVKRVIEEEWSYIPVGGPLPSTTQHHVGFGAAANLVHPATGYSVARSLSEAPRLAEAIAAALKDSGSHSSQVKRPEAARQAWETLWPRERKRQAAFFVFGMELLLTLDLADTCVFFSTFFKLPESQWRGFLSSSLSSTDLLKFALWMFAVAPNSMRLQLVKHLVTDPSGGYLMRVYMGFDSFQSLPLATVAPALAASKDKPTHMQANQ